MEIIECLSDVSYDFPDDILSYLFPLESGSLDEIEEIALLDIFHKDVNVLLVIVVETGMKPDDIGMLDWGQDFGLIDKQLPLVFAESKEGYLEIGWIGYFFDSKVDVFPFLINEIDLSKCPLANTPDESDMGQEVLKYFCLDLFYTRLHK
jgi:hypothetical protein